MVTFGGFETVYELYRHGLGSVSRARAAAGESAEPEYVVKVFNPPHRITGQDALKPAIESFLERARLQQDVATGGARYWAPVYEAGATRPGAYYVSRYYARSAQKLIASRVKLSGQALYAVVNAVVQGLLELKEACGRAHGNLVPSNVLIGGEGDLEQAPIVLTDPAPMGETGSNGSGESDDLLNVGELIYQLVLHRPFRGLQSWPIPRSPEWSRLGRKGEGWRELCNQLLDPNVRRSARLEMVAARVAGLRPKRWAITPARLAAVAVLAIVALGVVFAVRYNRFKGDWRQLCVVSEEWFYGFQRDLRDNAERRQRLEQDPHLAKALAPLLGNASKQLDPKAIAGNEMLVLSSLAEKPPLSWGAVDKTRRALATIRSVQRGLSPEEWPLLSEIADRQKEYQARGWDPCARYLGRLIEEVTPRRDAKLCAAIDGLLGARDKLKADLGAIESQWQVVVTARNAIAEKAADDKVLKEFDGFVRRYMASAFPAGQEVKDPSEIRPSVAALSDLAGHLNEVLQSDWGTRIDRERLVREADVYAGDTKPLEAKNFQDWLREVQDFYRYRLTPETEPMARLESMAGNAQKEIQEFRRELPNAGDVIDPFDKRLAALQKEVAAFGAKRWVNKDRRTDVIAREAGGLQNGFKTLQEEVWLERSRRTLDQKKWLEDVNRQTVADSAVINAEWKRWLKQLPLDGAQLPMETRRFMGIKERVDARKKLLGQIDKDFPPAPTLDDPYGDVARRKREEELGAVLAMAPSLDDAAGLATLQREQGRLAGEYTDWCRDAQAFLKNVRDARWLLDNGYGLAEAPGLAKMAEAWRPKPVWKDLSGEAGVATVLKRLEDLTAVGGMSRPQLAAKATAPESQPEIVLAAWRRLAGLDNPPWPARVEELKAEAAIRERLKQLLARAPDAFRKQALADEVQGSGPQRLVRFLNAAGGEPAQVEVTLGAAGQVAGAFDLPASRGAQASTWVRLARLEGVAPEVRFNLLLHGLRQTAGSLSAGDGERVARIRDDFREEIKALPADVRQKQAVADLLAGLDRVTGAERPAGPAAPWQRAGEGEGRVRFKAPGAADSALVLEFVLVESGTERPFYLCTTELSLAQFKALIPASDWGQARRQPLWEYRLGDDPRVGPRVWQWSGGVRATSPIEEVTDWLQDRNAGAQYFLTETPFNKLAMHPSIGVNPPGHPKLPMQYLPAPTALYVAGLLGCRLPTSDEWKAAYARAPRNVVWNLRDQTWEAQRAHVARNGGGLEWPDAGAFWPRDYKGPRRAGAQAESLSMRDNNLWFREVDESGGQDVGNLVGNVAEYVWDDALGFEKLQDKSLAGVSQFVERQADQLFVIGGSAISAPELGVDKPWPVDLAKPESGPNGRMGYADVGMRLAYSAPGTPVQRLVWILREQSYLARK